MKKSFIAKIAVLAAAILTIAVWTYAHAYELPEGWWLDYGDESDVFTTALDLKADEK